MNVAFVNPPFIGRFSRTSRSPAVSKGGTLYYPIWLAYAAGPPDPRSCHSRARYADRRVERFVRTVLEAGCAGLGLPRSWRPARHGGARWDARLYRRRALNLGNRRVQAPSSPGHGARDFVHRKHRERTLSG